MEPVYSRTWFDTFGRPEDAQTARQVAFLANVLPPPPARVLEVACGFGRHARALVERGYRVVGVECDPEVVAEACATGVDVRELDVRRLDELDETFDTAICMWASFGWWDDETNGAVLAAMARRTAPGGVVVLDLYDPAFFRGRDGTRLNRSVRDTKRVVGDRLETTLEYPDGSCDRFSWRLYAPDELRPLGESAGLWLTEVCADFDLTMRPVGAVPRLQPVFVHTDHAPRWENHERCSSSR